MRYVHLATEDVLSEAVGLKLIATFLRGFEVGLTLGKNGNCYLKSKMAAYCDIAKREPFLLITDLDNTACAPSLMSSWLGHINPPKNFMFRVAVREVEAWLLADQVAIKPLLGKQHTKVPRNPDSIPNPKEFLLNLAREAPRDVRRDLLAEHGAIASQGMGYNQRLCDYVNTSWSPTQAAQRSESLCRVIQRLEHLMASLRTDRT
jgi:hypothetical protein